MRALDVTEVTGVLHNHDAGAGLQRWHPGGDEPLREVADARRECVRGRRADQASVVLHRRAAAGAVDDNGSFAGHRRDDAGRKATGVAGSPRMDVQRATAIGARSRKARMRAGGAHDAERRRMHRTLPGIHDTAAKQPRVGRCRRFALEPQPQARDGEARQPQATRNEAEMLPEERDPRDEAEQPSPRQHESVGNCLRDSPQQGPPDLDVVRQSGARRFHEVSERDARWAGNLAAAALHALVHRRDERGIYRTVVAFDCAHGRDTTTG